MKNNNTNNSSSCCSDSSNVNSGKQHQQTQVVERNIHKFVERSGYLVSVYLKKNGKRKTGRAKTLEEARELRDKFVHMAAVMNEEGEGEKVGGKDDKQHEQQSSTIHPTHLYNKRIRRRIRQRTYTDISYRWNLGQAVTKAVELHWAHTPGGMGASYNARQAESFFGTNCPLEHITLERIDAFVEYLRRECNNSPATINRKLSALSKVLRTAYERGKMERRITMPHLKEAQHRVRFLTIEEERELFSTMVSLGYTEQAEAAQILLYTGMRCSELWQLELRDIDLVRKTLILWKTKNGHPRTVPIVSTILPIIQHRLTRQMQKGERKLFNSGSNAWLRNAWTRVRTLMNMDEDLQFVPHMLRHTCATRLAQHGVSMPIIKGWMGHTAITTTARYTHFALSDLHGAAHLLERAYTPAATSSCSYL